jgi:hypothetical protein
MSDWKNVADWSGLPDVYVTDVEQLDGVVWRVQACSVPLATAPEVRLVPAARIAALEAALLFYSDPNGDGYDAMVTDYGLSQQLGPIIRDAGERARAALAVKP